MFSTRPGFGESTARESISAILLEPADLVGFGLQPEPHSGITPNNVTSDKVIARDKSRAAFSLPFLERLECRHRIDGVVGSSDISESMSWSNCLPLWLDSALSESLAT